MCGNNEIKTDDQNLPHLGKLIHDLDNTIHRRMLTDGKNSGYDEVTVVNGWIIIHLARHRDEEIFQKDIEKEFSITKSTVTGIIKLMEQKGYLMRVGVARDARLKRLILTQKGYTFAENMYDQMVSRNHLLMKDITMEEMVTFLRVIDKIKENVKE